VRGEGGYEDGSESSHGRSVPRLRVLDLQVKAFSLQLFCYLGCYLEHFLGRYLKRFLSYTM